MQPSKFCWISSTILCGCTLISPNSIRAKGASLILHAKLPSTTQAIVVPYSASDIATLSIEPYVETTANNFSPVSSVTGEATTVEDVNRLKLVQTSPTIDPNRPFVIRKLKPNKKYRIYGRAYNQANALISKESTSYVDVNVGADDAPVMATLAVSLVDILFGATTSVTVNANGRFEFLKARVFQVSTGAEVMSTLTTRNPSELALSNLRYNTNYSLWLEAYKLGGVMASQSVALNIGNDNAPAIQSVTLSLPYIVSTLAGSAAGAADGIGTAANFKCPYGLAMDAVGNIYIGDQDNNRLRKITPNGTVSTLAGSAQGATDGTGTMASFYGLRGVAVDGTGNVYVADRYNHRIRKVTPGGVVSTLAGSTPGTSDGTGTAAMFAQPHSVALDGAGNVYVVDTENHRIRKITPGGVVSTLAGSTLGYADGTGGAAKFNAPKAVTVDGAGNLYVADWSNHLIRKITPGGVVTTLAGSTQGYADGTGTAAKFYQPEGITVDGAGIVYVSDTYNHRICKITPSGVVSTLVGSTVGYVEGTGTSAKFNWPVGLALDGTGILYVADYSNSRIRQIR